MPLFAFNGSVIPGSVSAWDGMSSLANGMAISVLREVGALGAAVRVRDVTYFTCARHVAGATQDTSGEAVSVWRGLGAASPWADCAALRRIMDKHQPGGPLYDRLDVAFLRLSTAAANRVDGHVVQPTAVTPGAGTALRYWGCRRGLVEVTFDGAWNESTHAGAFNTDDLNGLDTSACGVVRLHAGNYDFNAYSGDSGSSLWNGGTSVGQLVGVSPSQPLGIVVLYAAAFAALGLSGYEFV